MLLAFSQKVYEVVKKIPPGEFLSYKEVAKRAGNEKAYRVVGNLMAKNRDHGIPCHRVVKNNNEIGGYFGSYKNSWKKLALLLKEGVIAVIPTDTIYGICGPALNRETVERIYKLRKRNPKKPMIVLISSLDDLKIFGVRLKNKEKEILQKIWPGPVSVILPVNSKNFKYIHRGLNSIAFRIPKDKFLLKILKISGPLVAPSANWEGFNPAQTISEARRYFKNKVVYFNKGKIDGQPSTLIKLDKGKIKILRKGKDCKISNF